MNDPETVETTTRDVRCDGGGDGGHPRVYLTIGAEGWVECGYCDRRFVLTVDTASAESH